MRVGALPGAGRRRVAQQPAPPAGGVRHVADEGRHQRRRQRSASSTAGGTRASTATTAGPSATARPTPTTTPRTPRTRRRSTGSSRTRSCRASSPATTRGCRASGSARCALPIGSSLWQFSTARMLTEYVDRLYLPVARGCGGGHRLIRAGRYRRVLPAAVVVDREVEMAAGAVAGRPLVADDLADRHRLAGIDDHARLEVPVPALDPAAVVDDDAVARVPRHERLAGRGDHARWRRRGSACRSRSRCRCRRGSARSRCR